jgi:hypothetical protein
VARPGIGDDERLMLTGPGRTGDLLEPATVQTDLSGQLDDLSFRKDDDTRERLKANNTYLFASSILPDRPNGRLGFSELRSLALIRFDARWCMAARDDKKQDKKNA